MCSVAELTLVIFNTEGVMSCDIRWRRSGSTKQFRGL